MNAPFPAASKHPQPAGIGRRIRSLVGGCSAATLLIAAGGHAAHPDDRVSLWKEAKISPVTDTGNRHAIHTYYLTNPESPDKTRVLFYVSTARDGQHGDLIVRDRATGKETVIARDIDTEDAHRGACQQWISNGRRVAYHDVKNGRWSVHVVDLDTLKDRKLVEDRQLCFGRVVDDLVPIYGCHWNPGPHRDLEMLDVSTGKIRTVMTIADVERHSAEYLKKEFAGRPTSIFFPNISPDGRRVFFKMSAPGSAGAENNYKSRDASHRQGTFVYDLVDKKIVFMRVKWGHPAWHPDSRRIIEVGNVFFDTSENGKMTKIPNLPILRGNHLNVSPDGELWVVDGLMDNVGGPAGHWGIAVNDIRGEHQLILQRFNNSRGAGSWRRSHPHPVFNADARRIYFNVSDGPWTRLMVAERTR